MLRFIVLGLIPGTNIQLSFVDVVLAGSLLLGFMIIFKLVKLEIRYHQEHRSHDRQSNPELIAI